MKSDNCSTIFFERFEAPTSAYLAPLQQYPRPVITKYDADPFRYSFEELSWMARISGLQISMADDWEHPFNQKMAAFYVGQ
jgi:hypothetical protein